LMVERDGSGEAAEAREDPFAQAGEGASAVSLEGEEVFAGPEDRFDPLSDRCEVWSLPGLVFAARTHECGVALGDLGGEVAAGVALIAEQRLAAVALAAVQQDQADLALIKLGGAQLQGAWGAVGREDRGRSESPRSSGNARRTSRSQRRRSGRSV
jgi:hypothetical protein